ncbi:hypothetical protein HX13_19860 [Chryseobacterium sp. P1-3]|nr:hypothetical protein HX13_19860 [Chryseobacterium sp. P1-3]
MQSYYFGFHDFGIKKLTIPAGSFFRILKANLEHGFRKKGWWIRFINFLDPIYKSDPHLINVLINCKSGSFVTFIMNDS